ncbi:MAG TPA: glycine betaine ABC transporter substrate-binding protein, partial [Nocardioides sp.]|nr:glycine betaine ABC transporter substrate-binding protein [Nocardioides sp.]
MKTRSAVAALFSAALLVLTGCADDELDEEKTDDAATPSASGGGSVTIGSQNFDEAALVTAMYAGVLEDAGYDVTTKLVGRRDIYVNQMPGSIQIAPEYVGGIADFMNTTVNGEDAESITTSDTQESVDAVAPLLADKGLTLLEPSEATSQNAYFITQERSDAEGITKLSDLEGEPVVLAAHEDCAGRADCEAGLKDVYGIDITELLPLGYASPETYQSVIDGESQLGLTGTLDGTLDDQGLVLLEDDKGIQPAQNLIPAVSTEFLEEHPE